MSNVVYIDSYVVCLHANINAVSVGVGVDVCQSVSGVASVSVKC